MHITRRSPLWGAIIKHGLTTILLTVIVVLSVWTHEKLNEYQEIGQALDLTINEQSATIQEIKSENSELTTYISELEKTNATLKKENTQLKKENTQLEDEVEELSKEPKKETVVIQATKRDFKSYMPYTAITNRSSKQYKLQQQASTDKDGIRCINSKPMVAVGTGWGVNVGDTVLIKCENGNSFEAIIGDIKANAHTGSDNKTTVSNGCRCEFIVDMSSLNTTVKSRGNVAVLVKYSGYITDVVKI